MRAYVLRAKEDIVLRAKEDPAAGALWLSRVLSPRDAGKEEVTRWDVRLQWDDIVRDAVSEILRGPVGDAMHVLSGGDHAILFECAAIISAKGAAPQIVHSDTSTSDTDAHFMEPELHTAFVALQDIASHQGPTRFLEGTHRGEFGLQSHADLERDSIQFCEGAASVNGLLQMGDCTLYDSRLLHCGGPHIAPPPSVETTERVLLYVSFLRSDASLDNSDIHGAGSILPVVREMGMTLGQLRAS
eukprot:3553827-Pyramimonas_sp.AAC.1